MKQSPEIRKYRKVAKQLIIAGTFIFTFLPGILAAQTDSTKKEEPAAAVEESALISPSMNFLTVQKGDNTIDLKAALTAKFKGSVIKLGHLKITFMQVVDGTEKELGFAIADGFGKAVFNVKTDSLIPDKEGKLNFKAVFAGNKHMDPADGEVSIKRARLEITPVKVDSVLSVNVKLVDIATGKDVPVPETVLGIYVHRSFKPLKLAEGTTDENGEATIEVPNNLPGDPKGNITLMAKLDENETYGNLESAVVQKWGVPVSDKLNELPRALWSPHPPYWMMITFIILVGTVWGHYLVILIQLFRLRKEEPAPDSPLVEHLST
ncbi:MAG: hypothetical protein ACKOU7_09410 [Ferruginibacter sp.]